MRKASLEEIEGLLESCSGCGKKHLPVGNLIGGKTYCRKCKTKIAKCTLTGDWLLKKDMTYFKKQDIYISSLTPDHKAKSFISGDLIYVRQVGLPDKKNEAGMSSDGKWALIGELEEAGYILMKESRRWVHKDNVTIYGNLVVSKDNAAEDIIRAGKTVLNYSCKPDPIFRKTTEMVHGGIGVPFLGIELEVNTNKQNTPYAASDIASNLIRKMAESNTLEMFYMKSDGSIGNGVEIVSHPTTLSYFKKSNLKKFLEDVKELGFGDDDSCGLHIHVSRDALSKKCWWSLMTFLSKTSNKILKITRRDKTKLGYCKFTGMTGGVSEAMITGKDIHKIDVTKNNDRHSAVNFHNEKTVEFRMFRSTDDYDTIIATMEFVESLIMFAREYGFMYIQDERTSELWNEFVRFSEHKGYSRLIKFMESLNLAPSTKKNKSLCA